MELRNRRVTVMGLGSFGGGLGAAQFLVQSGAQVTITDLRSQDQLSESLRKLDGFGPFELHLGGHRKSDFTETDLVVVNPAVPRDCPFLELSKQAGIPLSSEMNLFFEFNPAKVIAITGSNGKSTTTAMAFAIMSATGHTCWLGGNIGQSLLPQVDKITPHDWVVLELSSFQLEDLDQLQKSPQVAIVTNFSPNHLDRHGTLENYRHAKQSILRWQSPDDCAVLNQDDADVAHWPSAGQRLYFGLRDLGREGLFAVDQHHVLFRWRGQETRFRLQDWLTLPGQHNLQNALGAACGALAIGVDIAPVEQGLSHYKALPHRLELIQELNQRQFYNDSLATTPESTMVALAAFDRPVILFAGGYDKGSDLTEMARVIAARPAKAVALMGTTGPRIAELLDQFDLQRKVRRHICSDFDNAFRWAIEQSNAGDVLVLSPGCASYDWFRNFADRGDQFRKKVEEYASKLDANV